jgi:hypothetical protein
MASSVTVKIYNETGQLVKTIENAPKIPATINLFGILPIMKVIV